MTTDHEILTIEEVASYLRVSERTVYDWANKGEIPCGKLGTTWRFKRSEIEKWVDERLKGPKQAVRTESVTLRDVLQPERVKLLNCKTKNEALESLIDCLAAAPEVKDRDELKCEVFERENLMSTGIGCSIGVPHVRLESVKDLVVAIGVNDQDIHDYQSLDDQPVRIVCMVAARSDQHAQYLKTLAAISTLMKSQAVRDALLNADDAAAAFALLTEGA